MYVKAKDPSTGRVYLVAEALLHELPGAVPKESKKKDKSQPKKGGFEVDLYWCACAQLASICLWVSSLGSQEVISQSYCYKLAAKWAIFIAHGRNSMSTWVLYKCKDSFLIHGLCLSISVTLV